MAFPQFNNIRWMFYHDGELCGPGTETGTAILRIDFADGTFANIEAEQILLWSGDANGVFLGPEWEDRVTVRVPVDDNPEHDRVFKGFTDNPEMVQLTREFVAAVNGDTFRPQNVFTSQHDLERS